MKKKLIIIITIIMLAMISIIMVFKKDTSEVVKNKVNKIERKEFSILKEQTYNGEDWQLSNDTTFPTSGYLLNNEQSKCYGYDNKPIIPIPVKQELTKGSIDGRVTIESSNTIYCELYFDLDNKVPEVNEFSITGKTSSGDTLNNGYTYGLDVTYKGNWLDEDVVQYCISDNNQSCSNWTEISNKDITVTSPSLTNGDGEKIMYIYLKDKANNISVTTAKSTAKIIVDQTKPVVNKFTLTGEAESGQTLSSSTDYTHKVGITYNATIEESNIAEYCVYEDSCSYQPTSSTTLNTSYTLTNTEGSHSVKIRVKDKAGNESDVSTQSIKLDLNNPTATISPNTHDTSSITVTVGYEGQDSIIARQCRLSGGSWVTASNSNGSCTISNLSDGTEYTIEGRVRDASGRWNIDYPSVNVKTDKKITGSYLLENPPAGLTVTDCNGMKRFAGRCDAKDGGCDGLVDNFICYGYSNESDCEGNLADNDFIYRIIGITPEGEMKLIKNKIENYFWHEKREDNTPLKWSESELYQEINGELFLNKISDLWNEKILKYNWPDGLLTIDGDIWPEEVCSLESKMATHNGLVGLILLSDWSYAGGFLGSGTGLVNYEFLPTTWIATKQNGSRSSDIYSILGREWTMQATYDSEEDRYGAAQTSVYRQVEGGRWEIGLQNGWREDRYPFRPVFFLRDTVEIETGSGTSTDPFIIAK